MMQIEQLPSTVTSPVWLVKLDCDDERDLSDDQIVKICENAQGVDWDHDSGRYRLNGFDFGRDVRGRCEVERRGDSVAVILHLD